MYPYSSYNSFSNSFVFNDNNINQVEEKVENIIKKNIFKDTK